MNNLFFIADIGANHNSNLKIALNLIYESKKAGFDAVKFQIYDPNLLYRDVELDNFSIKLSWLPVLHKRCQDIGIKFGCTAFHQKFLKSLIGYIDFHKISSFDVLRNDLINFAFKQNFDLFLSCGLISYDEIINILINQLLNFANYTKKICLMHCISNYPAKLEDLNIKRILGLDRLLLGVSKRDQYALGYSDHTRKEESIISAYIYGARNFEMHFDLNDCLGEETKFGHCWGSDCAKNIIEKINNLEKILLKEEKEISILDLMKRADPKDGLRPVLTSI